MCRFQYSLLRILRTQSFYHTLLPSPFWLITDVPALPIGTISLHWLMVPRLSYCAFGACQNHASSCVTTPPTGNDWPLG